MEKKSKMIELVVNYQILYFLKEISPSLKMILYKNSSKMIAINDFH